MNACDPEELQIFYHLLQHATAKQLQQAHCTPEQQQVLLAKLQNKIGPPPSSSTTKEPFPESILLYTDGASRGNPGPAGYGFFFTDVSGKEVYSDCGYLGETTNNVAEYEALFYGLQACLQHQIKQVQIRADSELMIKQLNGEYRVKNPNLVPLFHKIQEQLKDIRWSAKHIPREQNKRADILANKGVDQGRAPKSSFP